MRAFNNIASRPESELEFDLPDDDKMGNDFESLLADGGIKKAFYKSSTMASKALTSFEAAKLPSVKYPAKKRL